MTIASARKFLKQARDDAELRDALNAAADRRDRDRVLETHGFRFTPDEFDEAYRNELTKCPSESLAGQLHELHQWWQLLSRFA